MKHVDFAMCIEGMLQMNASLNVKLWLFLGLNCAVMLWTLPEATAAGPTSAPSADKPVSLFVTPPAYIYRAPGVVPNDTVPASDASDVEIRTPSSLEKPDNWACRTSNVLTRSSIGRNGEGKSISDYEHLMPKC